MRRPHSEEVDSAHAVSIVERDLFELEKQLRRCIKSWCDLSIKRQEWDRMYPKDVRDRALHRMQPEMLRRRE